MAVQSYHSTDLFFSKKVATYTFKSQAQDLSAGHPPPVSKWLWSGGGMSGSMYIPGCILCPVFNHSWGNVDRYAGTLCCLVLVRYIVFEEEVIQVMGSSTNL